VSETTTIREAVGDGAEGTHPMLLAGVATEGAESLPVIFPYDGSEIARVWLADERQLDEALRSAAAAEREIAAIPPFRRAEVLNAAAEIVRSLAR
jgi:acyl-CoA reductase-like NAD-dependent aldehyde dehydrogenase